MLFVAVPMEYDNDRNNRLQLPLHGLVNHMIQALRRHLDVTSSAFSLVYYFKREERAVRYSTRGGSDVAVLLRRKYF